MLDVRGGGEGDGAEKTDNQTIRKVGNCDTFPLHYTY